MITLKGIDAMCEKLFAAVGVAVVVGCAVGVVVGGYVQGKRTLEVVQQEAVKNDCGYYDVDQKTGVVQFRWREFPPRTMILKPNGVIEVPNE